MSEKTQRAEIGDKYFALAASLNKHEQTTTGYNTITRLMLGYRLAKERCAAIGDFSEEILDQNEGFSIGSLLAMEIPVPKIIAPTA